MNTEIYLGDGLYASFDGYQIKLSTPRNNAEHEVYLDPVMLAALNEWFTRLKEGLSK